MSTPSQLFHTTLWHDAIFLVSACCSILTDLFFWLESRCTVHRGIESIYLTYFWWMISCLTFFLNVIWVTVFVNYLRSHHFLVLFCRRIGTCQTIRWLRSPRESPRFSVLSSGTVSPERGMDDLIHKFLIQVKMKWRSVLIDTNTRQVKALTRSCDCGCNVNMSAGRESI